MLKRSIGMEQWSSGKKIEDSWRKAHSFEQKEAVVST
jgi:hypothetical protein